MIRKTTASVIILGLFVCVFLPVGFGIPAEESIKPGESADNRVLSPDGVGDYVQVADSQSLRGFAVGAWYNLAGTYDGNAMPLFVDSTGPTDVSDPDNPRPVETSGSAEEQKQAESDESQVSRQELDIIEYLEKTKSEILDGRKFSDQTTAANALLTLISAFHHQDRNTLEQTWPYVKRLRPLPPELRSTLLDWFRKSVICKIQIENKSPEESDLCGIYTTASPGKEIDDQVWIFAYVEGAWRFLQSTSNKDVNEWRTMTEKAEALTRNILQSEAYKAEPLATKTLPQEANKVEGKWHATLVELEQVYVMRFWRKPDGTLTGAATLYRPDDRPFNRVTFENGKLRFEEKTNQAVFEGTMKEDGLTIEGKWQKPGMLISCVLKRVEQVRPGAKGQADSQAVRASEKLLQPRNKLGESAVNRVLSLDGEEDYVQVADSPSLHSFTNAITIEVWLKASSFYVEDGYINSIMRKNIEQGIENFFLRFRNVAGKPLVEMSIGYDIEILRAPGEFTGGTWYHLAGTFDGSTMTVLVDGVSIRSNKVSGRPYIDKSDLFIGKGDPEFSFGEYFHGLLDEIRIWNVARSPEEIKAAMSTPLTGKEKGLVAYWNFNDGTAKDLSGHGNDGVLNGDAQIVESPHPASRAPQGKKPNKLVAWWKLDETDGNDVADSSGNRRVGRLVGNPQWRPEGGKVGGALEFDGSGDYIEVGNESAFDITGAITVAAWIKVNSFDKRWQTIVAKGDSSWRLQRTAGENTLAFHCTGIKSVLISSEWPYGIEGKKSVNDGQWHHAVGVYDGSTVSLYIDGVLDNSSPASGAIQTNDFAVNIGDNCEQINREWNGLIDEVCIIAGAIDAKGVAALYSGGDPMVVAEQAKTVVPARAPEQQLQGRDKLLAWWKFENNTNDSAGVNPGVIGGGPTYVSGKFGQAISLDGDDYVDCGKPGLLDFGTGNWTVSAWIKTTQSGADDANKGTVFANGADGSGGIRYTLAVNEAQSGMITLTTDDDLSKVQAISTTAVNDGAWHHVVGMRNERTLGVFVDGVLETTEILPAEYSLSGASGQNAYIGVIANHGDASLFKYFVGLIDEVCVFACALDANSVSAMYSGLDPMMVAEQTATVPLAQASDEQLEYPISGTGSITTTLILVLGLIGLIGGIVIFLIKSSIRT